MNWNNFRLSKSFKAVRNSFYCIPQGAGVDRLILMV
ncbi:hypothetical protein T09_2160 [Trichinella sp. T9]|nr:hypothetical protein T09_2160 [Trichinella sp. T9]